MIHIDDILVLTGNVGTDKIVEAICNGHFNNIVFSYAAQPIQMLHNSVYVDSNKHRYLDDFMAHMNITLDSFMEGNKHYDYLIVYAPDVPEKNLIHTVANWLSEVDLNIEQVIVVCQPS